MTLDKPLHPSVVFKQQLDKSEPQFRAALPSHIPTEHFMRVIMTAIQQNPRLLQLDRRSFFSSAMKAAQDGLLPDGREGALVPFRDAVQWMPMVAGLRKKVRNSGEIATWDCNVIYENDEFSFELGDEPFIRHRPILGNRGKPTGAYSVATLKSGERSRDVMSAGEIYAIRDRSEGWKQFSAGKLKSTPWSSDEGEMFKKTVTRRHSKVLPMSSDLIVMFDHDDEVHGEFQKPGRPPRIETAVHPQLDQIEGPAEPAAKEYDFDHDTGEIGKDWDTPHTAGVKEPGAPAVQAGKTEDLVAHAEAVAKTGSMNLTTWLDLLSAPDFNRLGGYLEDLHLAAINADGQPDGIKLSEEAKKRKN